MSENTEDRAPLVENAAVPQLLPIVLDVHERTLLNQVILKTNYAGEHCAVVTSALTKVASDIEESIEFNPAEYGLVVWSVHSAQFKGEVLEVAASLKLSLQAALVNPGATG
jgi:hypothetical protein